MITKLFIGIRVTGELKNALHHLSFAPLLCIPSEEKEFLGYYIDAKEPSVEEIRSHFCRLQKILSSLFPDQRLDKWPLLIFPQAFLG